MSRILRIVACAAVALVALMAVPMLRYEAAEQRDMAFGQAVFRRPPPDVRRTPDGRPIEPTKILDPRVEAEKPENQARLWKARAMDVGSYACWGVAALAVAYAVWPARREGGQS